MELRNLSFYDIKTEEPLPAGTEIHLTEVDNGSRMHLATSHKLAYYSIEDKDGDGYIDEPHLDIDLDGKIDAPRDSDGDGNNENISILYEEYAEQISAYEGGITIGTYANFNKVRPPSSIKLLDNDNGYIFVVPDTSGQNISDGGYYDNTESFGGFFGDTKFYYTETDFYLGTNHKKTNSYLVFR